jgi:NitT/TauT family transport system substrate-binding protein
MKLRCCKDARQGRLGRWAALVAALILVGAASVPCPVQAGGPLRFGTLPVLQAMPLFVAAEKGLFAGAGVEVDLIPFQSAMEKDVALSTGEIDGYFGDLLTPLVLAANGISLRMVATCFQTPEDRPMFALLAAPRTEGRPLEALAAEGVAISSNTIIDYITSRLLEGRGMETGAWTPVETKSIPIRLQLLLSAQVPLATLPEPLVTLAASRGARVLADDAGKGLSATVLAFRSEVLSRRPLEVRRFLSAVNAAAGLVRENPEAVRPVMNRHCRIPKPLQPDFPIPETPDLAPVDPGQAADVLQWLRRRGIVDGDFDLEGVIARDGLL